MLNPKWVGSIRQLWHVLLDRDGAEDVAEAGLLMGLAEAGVGAEAELPLYTTQ